MIVLSGLTLAAKAQSKLYPKHFDLEEVTLLDGPLNTAMELNFKTLLQYDVDRLLTPYVRQSGLGATKDSGSPYYHWEQKHPSFPNWGSGDFNLDGHVGGHYLSALALAYVACHEGAMKSQLKERMEYMIGVMKDCQDNYDENTEGLYGFIGGQPINQSWKDLFAGNSATIRSNWGWVPFYCQHKILAGLRDAYVYGGSATAREMFRKLADWSVNVIAKVTDSDLQGFLDCEHGGINESMLDAYQLFGDTRYLTAAKRYTHNTMLNGMQTLNTTFLDNRHANTQVPKYIGMERIGELGHLNNYLKAAENFWTDVAANRTVCIGGNSVAEHFLAAANSNRYIDNLDGPESCNTNNMLKLSEMLGDRTGDAKYVDFYEQAMWNHILSTQDPQTGGYVYFTTLRPQGYRIYSQVNQGMWCCVGTGMENHSKYGHFIYTHDGSDKLYVNLFTASRLANEDFALTQNTQFPFEPKSTLTVEKAGTYTIAIRHPAWAGEDFAIAVNGETIENTVARGKASYVEVNRKWKVGDVITVTLPMSLRYEECPNYGDYIAFKYGPILLAANVSPEGEQLTNEYAGSGRMDHAPGAMTSAKNLLSAPLLIGSRSDVLGRITPKDINTLTFTIDASRQGVDSYKWTTLTLQPFYQIHHARYSCYWYQQTAENYANSTMAKTEAENERMVARTLDFVAPGEQQSEAGHAVKYSANSTTGSYKSEHYRDAKANGYVQYTLFNNTDGADSLSVMLRFTLDDHGRMATLTVDGVKIADITIPTSAKGSDSNSFFNVEYLIPAELVAGKTQFTIRLTASSTTPCPGLYYLRLMRGYDDHAYVFKATDWTTGDTNRLKAAKISYDSENNSIHIRQTGSNNVCLMLNYADNDYTIAKAQKFLVVRGKGLRLTSGASYLWWLNGSNHGTQVAPTTQKNIIVGGINQQLIAWDMSKSGIYENFADERPNVCQGMTIFGLTASASNGECDIHDINFVADVTEYLRTATGIADTHASLSRRPSGSNGVYDIGGRQSTAHIPGIYIVNGQKILK